MGIRVRVGLAFVAAVFGLSGEARSQMELTVSVRDLPRHLVHARMVIPSDVASRPDQKLALWYPKWVPGTHAPCGPIQDVAGLRIETTDGKPIAWRRDETDVYRVLCDVPPLAEAVVVKLDLICDRASAEAAGYLTFGNDSVAIINWATCLMYAEGRSAWKTRVRATLADLPASWGFACAMKGDDRPGPARTVAFPETSLMELVDNPVIAGEHVRKIPLDTGGYAPAFLDLASGSPSALQLSPEVIGIYSRVVREACALTGRPHYPAFHFLITCDDDLGYLGLEHLACSINGVHERDLVTPGRLRGWVGNLLPHEYIHSWCGKFRRPAGMCTDDFQTPQKTKLLWVYEGLAEYLGEVLMVRSGMIDVAEYRRMLTGNIDALIHREGRRWRSLEDTAVASHLLRGGNSGWNELRRSQDYYFEGALVWLEADAIIREKTGGKRTLDDFCRRFLGYEMTEQEVVPYELADVVKALDGVCPYDWERFLRDRTERPMEALPVEVVGRVGFRLNYTTRPPSSASRISRSGGGGASARDSIGLSFDAEGKVTEVVPGKVGDRSGMGPGMKVIGVNGKVFNAQRLHDALLECVRSKKITFLLVAGDHFRTVELPYGDGPRYLELVRDSSRPDLLAEILKPIAVDTPKPAPAKPSVPAATSALPRGYIAYRAKHPIRIDGRLDDDEWRDAPWTEDFVDIEGDVRPKPRFRTRARLLWDDDFLYVGAMLEEPDVWATLTKHDSVIFHDNDFEVFVDPDGDNNEYYEIEINALNAEWDLFLKKPYRDGGPAINEWEIPGLKTAVHVEGTINRPGDRDASWSVEFAIPWKVLAEYAHRPSPPRDGDRWRVNFSRVEWRHEVVDGAYRKVPKTREDNWVWSPQGAIDMHRPERWGYVQFSTAAPGQATFTPVRPNPPITVAPGASPSTGPDRETNHR